MAFTWFLALSLQAASVEIYSDDFNDNTKNNTKWGADFDFEDVGGALDEISQRLEFTSPSTGFFTRVRPWILKSPSYNQDWEVIVDVANSRTFPTASDGVSMGVAVQNPNNPSQVISAEIFAVNEVSPKKGFSTSLRNNGSEDAFFDSPDLNVSQGKVRLTFDSVSKVVRAYYKTTENWVLMASYGISASGGGTTGNRNWGMSGSAGMNIAVYGFSGNVSVSVGQVYADNFQLALNTQDSSANTAPAFTSSPVTTAVNGVAYSYTATATDLELNTITFSKFSGPSWLNVAASGTVSGTPPDGSSGTFSVTIRATDNATSPAFTDQNYSITVRSTFSGWQALKFALPAESALAAPDADPDGDGRSNLIEYALNTNPRLSDTTPGPTLTFDGGDRFTIALRVRDDAPGLSAVAEICSSLPFGIIYSATGVLTDPVAGDGFKTLTFTDNVNKNTSSARFARFMFSTSE